MTPKELIVEIVERKQGGKGPELIPEIVHEFVANGFTTEDVPDLLQQLVDDGELVEVEYNLPGPLDYMLKSFYLPKGTKARLINAESLE